MTVKRGQGEADSDSEEGTWRGRWSVDHIGTKKRVETERDRGIRERVRERR